MAEKDQPRNAQGQFAAGNTASQTSGRRVSFPLPRNTPLGRSGAHRAAELLAELRAKVGKPTAAQTASAESVAVLEVLLRRLLRALGDAKLPETAFGMTRLACWLLHERDRRLIRLLGEAAPPADNADPFASLLATLGDAPGPSAVVTGDRPSAATPATPPADPAETLPAAAELPADDTDDDEPGQPAADQGDGEQLAELERALRRFGGSGIDGK